jgi:hypothetical protein
MLRIITIIVLLSTVGILICRNRGSLPELKTSFIKLDWWIAIAGIQLAEVVNLLRAHDHQRGHNMSLLKELFDAGVLDFYKHGTPDGVEVRLDKSETSAAHEPRSGGMFVEHDHHEGS